MLKLAEYIWLDGNEPTQTLRSKAKVCELNDLDNVNIESFPEWSFDGSSTYQASGNNSDLILKPVSYVNDPIRGKGNYLVLCEVLNSDGTPHESNTRARLRKALDNGGKAQNPLVGFEQEYTLFNGNTPLGWPDNGFPAPQGPFYCGVGTGRVYGRELVEKHTKACIDAGIAIFGINAEVMPGQWEFQVGYRGFEADPDCILTFSDHLIFARWLLCRMGEDMGVTVSFDNKPVKGDWNGAGCHTNFSTTATRDPSNGVEEINKCVERLSKRHQLHIENYGANLSERLTGLHETCAISEFKAGISDRGCSIRIPLNVQNKGYGYFEDRRPGANCDPYVVCSLLIETCCLADNSRESSAIRDEQRELVGVN